MLETGQVLLSLFSLAMVALVFGILSYKLIKLLGNGSGELNEIDNFISEEELILGLKQKKGLNIYEGFPLLIVIVVFVILNYLFFFK